MNLLASLCRQLLNCSPGTPSTRAALDHARDWLEQQLKAVTPTDPTGSYLPTPLPLPLNPQLAPLFSLEGLWLAGLFSPASGHLSAQCLLHPIYLDSLSLEAPGEPLGRLFRAHRALDGKTSDPVKGTDLALEDLGPLSAHMVLIILTFQHSPIRYFPEILGFTLAHLQRPQMCFEDHVRIERRKHHLSLAESALKAANFGPRESERSKAGTMLYQQWLQRIAANPEPWMEKPPEPARAAMAKIIQGKMAEARGYHTAIHIGGQSLDDWFGQGPEVATTIVHLLETTKGHPKGCPMAKRLVDAMAFGGPMYGVFNPNEQEIAASWLKEPETPISGPAGLGIRLDPAPRSTPAPSVVPGRRLSISPRGLYWQLLQMESPLEVPEDANRWLDRLFARTAWWTRIGVLPKPKPYSLHWLEEWIRLQHRKAVDRHPSPPKPVTVDKTFCRWMLLQMAPAILVDGAWLWGLQKSAEDLKPWDRELIRIQFDELGEGVPRFNHPNVYRDLLQSEDIELPDFRSEAFRDDPRWVRAAFDFPCTLLSMGALQSLYPAECLGLNLAIETSGLGTHYLRAIEVLRHHGINPAIIALHLSIDNLSSGHSQRALRAIHLYLDAIRDIEGPEGMQAAWHRIWRGFNSFKMANLPMTTTLIGRFFLHQHGRLSVSLNP